MYIFLSRLIATRIIRARARIRNPVFGKIGTARESRRTWRIAQCHSRRESLVLFDLWKMSFSFESESCAYVVRAMWQMLYVGTTFYDAIVSGIAPKVPVYERPAIGIVVPQVQSGIIVRDRMLFFFLQERSKRRRVFYARTFFIFYPHEFPFIRENVFFSRANRWRWIIYYLQTNQQRI